MHQKRGLYIFKKNIIRSFFLKFSTKIVLCPQGHIFSKVNRGIVQRPDEVLTSNWPGRLLLLRQVFSNIKVSYYIF